MVMLASLTTGDKMAKVTYLHDLVRRQFEQILAMDKEELLWNGIRSSKRQASVAGRSTKVVKQLVDLEWAAMLRPTQAPDTFAVGYSNEQYV